MSPQRASHPWEPPRHLQGARDIKEILEARLATLRQADRPGGAG